MIMFLNVKKTTKILKKTKNIMVVGFKPWNRFVLQQYFE